MIQNAYTEMHNGSKNVAVMVRNSMAYPQTVKKKIPVARVVVANQVPEPQVWPGMIDTLDEAQGIQTQKLTTEQRQEKLFEKLDLSSFGTWLPELADSAHSLLVEYHNIFSSEPCKLGCTHLTEHVIKVTNYAPFKEWFRQIPPPLVEEIHAPLQEMLDSGTVCPSQSVWCNIVVLVQKDRSLHFCIDVYCLNTTQTRTPTHCQESKRHLKVWLALAIFYAWIWSLDSGNQDGWAVKAVHHIYCWQPGLLQVWLHAFWAVQCTSQIPEVNAELLQGTESNILPHLPWWYNRLLTDNWGIPPPLMHCLWLI